jgi:hypothetical protein
LVRPGQRVIQKENAATIILTIFSALSKGLVHDVFLSKLNFLTVPLGISPLELSQKDLSPSGVSWNYHFTKPVLVQAHIIDSATFQ